MTPAEAVVCVLRKSPKTENDVYKLVGYPAEEEGWFHVYHVPRDGDPRKELFGGTAWVVEAATGRVFTTSSSQPPSRSIAEAQAHFAGQPTSTN
jgi:hypothetical protein